MDLMVWKYRFGKERYIKQSNKIREWQKKTQQNFTIWQKKAMSEQNQGLRTWEEEHGRSYSFAR